MHAKRARGPLFRRALARVGAYGAHDWLRPQRVRFVAKAQLQLRNADDRRGVPDPSGAQSATMTAYVVLHSIRQREQLSCTDDLAIPWLHAFTTLQVLPTYVGKGTIPLAAKHDCASGMPSGTCGTHRRYRVRWFRLLGYRPDRQRPNLECWRLFRQDTGCIGISAGAGTRRSFTFPAARLSLFAASAIFPYTPKAIAGQQVARSFLSHYRSPEKSLC